MFGAVFASAAALALGALLRGPLAPQAAARPSLPPAKGGPRSLDPNGQLLPAAAPASAPAAAPVSTPAAAHVSAPAAAGASEPPPAGAAEPAA